MSDRHAKKRSRSDYERTRHSSSRRYRYERDESRDRRLPSKSTKLDDGRRIRSESRQDNGAAKKIAGLSKTLAEVGLLLSYADMNDEYVSQAKVIFDAYVRNYGEYNPHLGHFENNMKNGNITNPTPGQVLAFTSLTYKEPKKNTLLELLGQRKDPTGLDAALDSFKNGKKITDPDATMPMKQALELARRIESEPSLLDGIEDEITKKYLNEGASNGKIVLKYQKE